MSCIKTSTLARCSHCLTHGFCLRIRQSGTKAVNITILNLQHSTVSVLCKDEYEIEKGDNLQV